MPIPVRRALNVEVLVAVGNLLAANTKWRPGQSFKAPSADFFLASQADTIRPVVDPSKCCPDVPQLVGGPITSGNCQVAIREAEGVVRLIGAMLNEYFLPVQCSPGKLALLGK
jgi:hypothetical protein